MLGWEIPPHNSGGLGVACYQLCQSLSANNVDIEFILPYEANHNIDFMKLTAAVARPINEVDLSQQAYDSSRYSVTREGLNSQSFDYFDEYTMGVQSVVSSTEFDIIHAHDWLTFRAAIAAKQQSGKPLIVHVHATEFDRSGGNHGNSVVEEIEYFGMMIADRIIAVSQLTKEVIMKHYNIPADKIDVIHNSIDPEYYQSVSPGNDYHYIQKLKENGYSVVTNAGRHTIQKGLHNFLLAAKEVIFRAPKTIFLLVGAGDQYYELIEHAAGLGISKNVIFADFQRGKRLHDAFEISDLFVMPSVSEPFGLVPLEAIHFGTPTLVTKQSGVAEILHNALKVDYWDVGNMANQITAVIQSNNLGSTLLSAQQEDMRRSSWSSAAKNIVGIYESSVRSV